MVSFTEISERNKYNNRTNKFEVQSYLHVIDVDVCIVGQRIGRRQQLVQHRTLVVRKQRSEGKSTRYTHNRDRKLLQYSQKGKVVSQKVRLSIQTIERKLGK